MITESKRYLTIILFLLLFVSSEKATTDSSGIGVEPSESETIKGKHKI